MTMPLCDGLRPGKNSASVFVFLHFFWMCAAVSIYIVFKLHKKKTSTTPLSTSSLPPSPSAICLIQPLHPACVLSTAFSFPQWRARKPHEKLLDNFRLLPSFASLPANHPHRLFIHLFLCLFHPFCSGKYPLKQMPLIPLAPHYKICPILRQEGGVRNKKSKEESPLSCFLFTHIYRRR